MDRDESDMAKAKWVLIGAGLFFVSCFMVWSELMYLLKGKVATATLTEAYEVQQRGRFGSVRGSRIELEYRFTEADGTPRAGSARVSTSWEPPPGPLQVEYTPGANGRSRFKGDVNWFWVLIFFGSLIALIVFILMMAREARELDRPKKR
jgi:hypothetical protein